ncbi:MAG: DUF1194 domain-containing protein [Sulfitobacter sp.]
MAHRPALSDRGAFWPCGTPPARRASARACTPRVMIRAAALAFGLLAAAPLAAQCRQALALGLDVSGSVDAREYRLQLDGLALALLRPDVRAALLDLPDAPLRILVYEWSGPGDERLLLPWTEITGPAALEALAETLRQTRRVPSTPGTALGGAMALGAAYLAQQPGCWQHTLDISGDGKSNLGPRPREVREVLEARAPPALTLNALVIGALRPPAGAIGLDAIGDLSDYFTQEVIFGPGAFVITAQGFDDYANAMATKLLRETDGLQVSQLPASKYSGSDRSNTAPSVSAIR